MALTPPFLSVSTMNSSAPEDVSPSTVAILPETLSLIGAIFFFGSFFGVMPPLKVSTRFPTFTTVGL